ncbi:YIP1 family protein, partial [Elusimicrobiota bacterium]
ADTARVDPQGMINTAKQVILKPYDFFRSMPKEGGFKDPAIFLVAMTVATQAITLALGLGLGVLRLKSLGVIKLVLMVIGPAFFGLFIMPIAMLIAAAVAHLIWMLLGSKENFETSFRCVAYTSAIGVVYAVASKIPLVGMWLAIPVGLYGVYLFLPASTEVHGVKKKSAAIVAGIFAFIVLASGISSAIMIWKLKRLARSVQNDPRMQALNQLKRTVERAQQGASRDRMQVTRSGQEPEAIGGADAARAKQALNAFTQVLGAKENVAAVDHKQLKAVLPRGLSGMNLASAESGRHKLGRMDTAVAKGVYESASGGKIFITIADAGSLSGMLEMAWGLVDMEKETDTSYERTLRYKGGKAHEKYDRVMREGIFETIVAKRFSVKVKGRGVDMDAIRAAADQVDVGRLQSLAE